MKTRFTLLLSVITLLQSFNTCFSQNPTSTALTASVPPFVKELMQGAPPEEMRVTDPALYNHLQKKRMTFIGLLAKEIKAGRLPDSLMQAVMKPRQQMPQQSIEQRQAQQTNAAANFKLTKDVNTATNSNPGNYNSSYTPGFATIGNTVYFQADDGIHGTELWSSDGTESGTSLVKDINTGSASSYPGYITVFKNKLYFSAYTADYGYELYVSNGTAAGTNLLKDIEEGVNSSSPDLFTVVDNTLYFVTDGNSNNNQLWKTNGTANGTKLVQDVNATSSAAGIFQLAAANGLLYFTAFTYTYGRELWRSDGSSAGTYMLKDINPNNNQGNYYYDGGPANLTEFDGKLYFTAYPSSAILWQTDGTAAGTMQSKNNDNVTIYSSNYFAVNQPFAIANNTLYFGGYTPSTGYELYNYRPSTGVKLVKDITPSGSSYILTESIRSIRNSVYFSFYDYSFSTNELWTSNGNSSGTSLVKALPAGIGYYNFYSLNNKLYFSLYTSTGYEPWVSDGTSAGTGLLKDINIGANSSSPSLFSLAGNKVFFRALTNLTGIELWQTKGSSASTAIVKDINTTTTGAGVLSFYYNYNSSAAGIALNNNKIVFNGYTPQTGYEIWTSNGSSAGTKLVKELAPNETSVFPRFYTSKNAKAYFSGYDTVGHYEGVFVTDGTPSGTKLIASADGYIIHIDAANNGNVYFLFYSYTSYSYELWKVKDDGSSLQQLKTSCSDDIAVAGNTCFFTAYDAATGYELWKTDGTLNNTKLVADINEGTGSSNPYNFVAFNNKVLFSSNYYNNYSLYISDGTESGTTLLKSMYFYPYNSTAIAGGELYFAGYDYNTTYGEELYKTDGTPGGTKLVKDIYTGNSSNPVNMTAVGNTVYFSANDGINGTELWKTRGSEASTRIVKDIVPGLNSGNSYSLTSAGGKLYFISNGALWYSEGTSATTKAVNDAGLEEIDYINFLIGAGNKLFFSAYNYAYSTELYEGDVTAFAGIASHAIASSLPVSQLSAKLITNPFINDVVVGINSPKAQQLQISLYDVAGRQLITKHIHAAEGSLNVSFNGTSLPQGVYMISVSNGKETIQLKAIK